MDKQSISNAFQTNLIQQKKVGNGFTRPTFSTNKVHDGHNRSYSQIKMSADGNFSNDPQSRHTAPKPVSMPEISQGWKSHNADKAFEKNGNNIYKSVQGLNKVQNEPELFHSKKIQTVSVRNLLSLDRNRYQEALEFKTKNLKKAFYGQNQKQVSFGVGRFSQQDNEPKPLFDFKIQDQSSHPQQIEDYQDLKFEEKPAKNKIQKPLFQRGVQQALYSLYLSCMMGIEPAYADSMQNLSHNGPSIWQQMLPLVFLFGTTHVIIPTLVKQSTKNNKNFTFEGEYGPTQYMNPRLQYADQVLYPNKKQDFDSSEVMAFQQNIQANWRNKTYKSRSGDSQMKMSLETEKNVKKAWERASAKDTISEKGDQNQENDKKATDTIPERAEKNEMPWGQWDKFNAIYDQSKVEIENLIEEQKTDARNSVKICQDRGIKLDYKSIFGPTGELMPEDWENNLSEEDKIVYKDLVKSVVFLRKVQVKYFKAQGIEWEVPTETVAYMPDTFLEELLKIEGLTKQKGIVNKLIFLSNYAASEDTYGQKLYANLVEKEQAGNISKKDVNRLFILSVYQSDKIEMQ